MSKLIFYLSLFSSILFVVPKLNVPSVVLFQDKAVSELKTKLELPNIFGDLLQTINQSPLNWEYTDPGYIYNQYLRMNNIRIDIESSILEVSELSYTLSNDKEILTGNNVLYIKFIFDYEAKLGISTFTNGKGYIQINSNSFVFKKYLSSSNSGFQNNGTVSLDLNVTTNYTVQSPDATLSEYFKRILSDNLKTIKNRVLLGFNNSTYKFYTEQANNQILNYPVELSTKNSYKIDLTFLENPLYNFNRGIVFYHNGEVTKDDGNKGFLRDTIHKKWDKFNPDEGNFQIFLSSFILEQIVNDISETNSIKFRVENKNLPLNCIFRLQIEYLGHIIPKVYDEFARDVEIFVTLNVTQIQLKMNSNNLIGELNLQYNIYSKEKLLLSYNILYDFGLLPIYQNQLFDLILNGLKIKDTTVVYNPYGMLDEENLRTYSSDSLNNYLQENPFYLFRQHMDFNTIFDNSKLIVVENEGIVIGGNRNNFSTSGSTKNVERMIISMIKRQLN